jgi:DNA-binding LacI/PurR family transcriptional regulator
MLDNLMQLRCEKIAVELRRRILDGTYKPHAYLPGERQLATEFRASRSTVATALEQLVKDGLVMQTQGRGTRVLPPMERLTQSVIGVVHNMMLGLASPEPAYIMEGILHTFARLNYRYERVAMIWPNDPPPAQPVRQVTADTTHTLPERYGALIFIEALRNDEQILALQEKGVPLVVANLEQDLDVSATWVDHRKITYEAVRILAALGHRRIALLTRPADTFFYGKAKDGYLSGMQAMGLPADESLIAVTPVRGALAGYVSAKPLLGLSDRPTAIIATRDSLAEGACQAITEAGLMPGRDVSLIGFDDISWGGDNSFLTTFREPCFEMGVAAAEMLAEKVMTGDRSVQKREIEAPLVLRRSACPRFDDTGRPESNRLDPVLMKVLPSVSSQSVIDEGTASPLGVRCKLPHSDETKG